VTSHFVQSSHHIRVQLKLSPSLTAAVGLPDTPSDHPALKLSLSLFPCSALRLQASKQAWLSPLLKLKLANVAHTYPASAPEPCMLGAPMMHPGIEVEGSLTEVIMQFMLVEGKCDY